MTNDDSYRGTSDTPDSDPLAPQLALSLINCVSFLDRNETTLVTSIENRGKREALDVQAEVPVTPFAD